MFSMAMWTATLVAPLQLVIGDPHGTNTYEHQPAKGSGDTDVILPDANLESCPRSQRGMQGF